MIIHGRNPFSPVRELPMLGILGAVAMVLQFSSAKNMTVTDCIVMCCIDPIVAAMLASIALGKALKILLLLLLIIIIILIMIVKLILGPASAPLQAGPDLHRDRLADDVVPRRPDLNTPQCNQTSMSNWIPFGSHPLKVDK